MAEAVEVEPAQDEPAAEAEAVVEEAVAEEAVADEPVAEEPRPRSRSRSSSRRARGLRGARRRPSGQDPALRARPPHRGVWSEPTVCHARPTRSGPECGRQLYPIGELPEQVQKALNPLKASKKASKG